MRQHGCARFCHGRGAGDEHGPVPVEGIGPVGVKRSFRLYQEAGGSGAEVMGDRQLPVKRVVRAVGPCPIGLVRFGVAASASARPCCERRGQMARCHRAAPRHFGWHLLHRLCTSSPERRGLSPIARVLRSVVGSSRMSLSPCDGGYAGIPATAVGSTGVQRRHPSCPALNGGSPSILRLPFPARCHCLRAVKITIRPS